MEQDAADSQASDGQLFRNPVMEGLPTNHSRPLFHVDLLRPRVDRLDLYKSAAPFRVRQGP